MSTSWLDSIVTSAGAGRWPLLYANMPSSLGATTLALDSAYVYNSDGDAFMFTFVPHEDGEITDIWVRVGSHSGTWSSTDQAIDVEIRQALAASYRPGSTLTGSTTITLPGTNDVWVKKSGLSIAVTAGVMYCIVVGDADGGATNYVTMTIGYSSSGDTLSLARGSTTSNGWVSGSSAGVGGAVVLKIGGKLYGGAGVSAVSTVSLGTAERGNRIKFPEAVTLVGMAHYSSDSTQGFSSSMPVRLYTDGQLAGDTPIVEYTPTVAAGATAPAITGVLWPESLWTDLDADTWYRFVVAPTSTTTTPRKATVGGSPDADVIAAMAPFGSCYAIWDAGGAVWSEEANSWFGISPIVVPRASGGGTPFDGLQALEMGVLA